jgi:hypothetical protein
MKRALREKTIEWMKQMWDRRDIPGVPDHELSKLSDDDIGYLARFWTHKDRWWDIDDAPGFNEEPPRGFAAMERESRRMGATAATVKANIARFAPPAVCQGVGCDSRNFGHTFKTPAGGALTERQSAKKQGTP